jgi:lipoprotein-releasing system ATP-binding protein
MSEPALELTGVTRGFKQGRGELRVLAGVDLAVEQGEIVALVAPSGAGKSTLLHIAGLLEHPGEGDVSIGGIACGRLPDDRRTEIRRKSLGFVYQYHHLLPEFSALENVVLPQMIAGKARREAATRGRDLLGRLGLAERAEHRPGQLSGGEQQRVAICRALANGPRVLLADEPTGNLDPHTAETVFDELVQLARGAGLAALIATHNLDLARRMDRVVRLQDGRIVSA